jgi:hypothetical protein
MNHHVQTVATIKFQYEQMPFASTTEPNIKIAKVPIPCGHSLLISLALSIPVYATLSYCCAKITQRLGQLSRQLNLENFAFLY